MMHEPGLGIEIEERAQERQGRRETGRRRELVLGVVRERSF